MELGLQFLQERPCRHQKVWIVDLLLVEEEIDTGVIQHLNHGIHVAAECFFLCVCFRLVWVKTKGLLLHRVEKFSDLDVPEPSTESDSEFPAGPSERYVCIGFVRLVSR